MARKPGAFAVIFDDRARVLLCHRTDRNAWNLPGGGIEDHESPREAVIREVAEEIGLEVAVQRLVGMYFMPSSRNIAYTFHCVRTGGCLRTSNEADQIGWFERGCLPETTLPRHIERVHHAYDPSAPVFLCVQV